MALSVGESVRTGLTEVANKGTVWVVRAGARMGNRWERERRIQAPVTSTFIPQIDVAVKLLRSI